MNFDFTCYKILYIEKIFTLDFQLFTQINIKKKLYYSINYKNITKVTQ